MAGRDDHRCSGAGSTAPRETWLFAVDGEEFAILEEGRQSRPFPATLSTAERLVAFMAGAGLTNAEIARHRGCGTHTVAKQLSAIYRKLGVDGRASLQAWFAAREKP